MDNRIEAYFGKTLTSDERERFEQEIRDNPELADQVAFFLATRKAQAEGKRRETLEIRHSEWQQLRGETPTRSRNFAWVAAAAVIIALAIGTTWYLNAPGPSYRQLAIEYTALQFQTIDVRMSGTGDSLQLAARFFNEGNPAKAREVAETLLIYHPDHAEAQKIAGIASLRLKDYERAVQHFRELGTRKDLFSNPGKFYEALALLERDGPGDMDRAEALLGEVTGKDLEGKEVVEKWKIQK